MYTKAEVGFEHPAKGPDHCGDCKHYLGGSCAIVAGDVQAGDWCKKFVEITMAEHSPEEKAHFHRAMSHLHQGGLHRALGISEDQKIPLEKKEAAAHSSNPHTAAMGRLAVAMHGWK